MILKGRYRRPVDGRCHCFTILNVRFIKKCAVHHSICVNMLFLMRSWCVQERVTWLASDFDMEVQRGKLDESSSLQAASSRNPVSWRSFRNRSLTDPGTRNGLHTLSLSNCRTSTARDLLGGWIPQPWTLRRRTNPIALNDGYFCSTFALGGPKATDVANEAARRRSQEPSADVIRYLLFFCHSVVCHSSHNRARVFRMLVDDDFVHWCFQRRLISNYAVLRACSIWYRLRDSFQSELTHDDMNPLVFGHDVAVICSMKRHVSNASLDLHDLTYYVPFFETPPNIIQG